MRYNFLKETIAIEFKTYKKNTGDPIKSNIPLKYHGKSALLFLYIYDQEKNLSGMICDDITLSQNLDDMIYGIVKEIKKLYIDKYMENDFEEDPNLDRLLEHLVLDVFELDTNEMRATAKLYA